MTPELLIGLAVVLIPALASVIVSVVNHTKLAKLEISINGRLSQLLEANDQAARAEGLAAGSIDSTAIESIINRALTEALALPPPGTTLVPAAEAAINVDTNARVRNIQDEAAAVAAALIVKNAAQIAAALVVRTAEEAAEAALAKPNQDVSK